MKYDHIMDILTQLLLEVGDYQVEKFKARDFSVDTKSTEIDMVTEVDKRSETMIKAGLKRHFPTFGYLAEESGKEDMDAEYVWYIDPLDGTTNFASGVPIFAISVGLKKFGQTILGAVYNPMSKDMFTAIQEQGAQKNGKAIQVNQMPTLRQSVVATGFPYDRADNPINNVKAFSDVVTHVKGIRRLGVAAYDLCLVAEGVFAAYWEFGLKPWDYTAGLLIAQEAGAVYEPLLDREGSLIVSNSLVFEELKAIIKA